MKLIINEQTLEIIPKNTNFVDYWTSKVFGNNNTRQCDTSSLTSGKNYNLKKFKNFKKKLFDLLLEFNRIVETENLPNYLAYDIKSTGAPDYLEYVHEKWAHFTIQSYHVPSPEFNRDMKSYCEILNQRLNKKFGNSVDTRTINDYVHDLEHLYLYYQSDIVLPNGLFLYNEYRVTEDDTIFGTDNLLISYWDIGRPQYEKWIISKNVTSKEINNFEAISPRIEVRAECINVTPHVDYVRDCNTMNLPVWGNKLSLGNINLKNCYDIGYTIINSLNENTNDYVGFSI
jgi:hypothetical protein